MSDLSNRFDVSAKDTLDPDPISFLLAADIGIDGEVTELSPEVSTVVRQADRMYRIDGPIPWLCHLEILAQPDFDMPRREEEYHFLGAMKHKLPVMSVVLLLTRQADHPELTGELRSVVPNGFLSRIFNYKVVRLWEIPYQKLMSGSVYLLPYAALAMYDDNQVAQVMDELAVRINQEISAPEAKRIWGMIKILLGLRFSKEVIDQMIVPLEQLEDSTTYQYLIKKGEAIGEVKGEARGEARGEAKGEAKGRIEAAREILLTLGTDRFGPPSRDFQAIISAISSATDLKRLATRVLHTDGWAELLTDINPASNSQE